MNTPDTPPRTITHAATRGDLATHVGLTPPGAQVLAWLWLALAHAVLLAVRLPATTPARTWLQAQGFVVAHTIVIGTILGVASLLWREVPRAGRRAGSVLAALAGWLFCALALADDLSGRVAAMPAWLPPAAGHALLSLVAAAGLVASHTVGRALARPWWRLGLLLGATSATALNAYLFPLAYPGVHLWVTVAAGLGLGAALTGACFPVRFPPSRWLRVAGWGALVVISVAGLVARPSNRALIELSHQPVAVLMPFLAPYLSEATTPLSVPPDQREWFVDRGRLPVLRPSKPNPLPPDAIVLMIGFDSMRADVLHDESLRATLPNLFALRDSGVWFTNARSPGASTAPAIASLFASRYYSQLYWTEYVKRRPEVFPHSDPSPRFPELLAAQGVATVTVDTAGWLLNEFGIVRGFTEEQSARVRGYPSAAQAGRRLRERLAKQGDGPLFAFIHFLDAHAPYTAAGKRATPKEGYLASLGKVDEELGEWVATIRARQLQDRTVWILFSDHGEAFGEHGLTFHSNSLYDELLRVPLVFASPQLKARRVDVPVSLVDVGPTVLDAFRVGTPPTMMGQSLLPWLIGSERRLTRPIVAEAQLKRALISPKGVKVIHDTRRKTLEIYDLIADPGELDNLVESSPDRHGDLAGTLANFFHVHTHRQEGYQVPYRRW
ncbi:MAG: sulfatase [Polyangiaceae bacterium]|nr:sulfatase [Polyangiaceae bacterium]